jgi:predicted Zn finger-like uncharacterized protein
MMSGSIGPIVRGSTMVAGCPKCSARYRVDAERIGPDGAKLRCTKCSAVFLVRAPLAASEPPPAAPEPKTAPKPEVDSERLVLVADPDEARGKATAEAIENWGLTPLLVHDGVEAMLAIQRNLPTVVILDAGLPKMFGFQICEIVKRNESLRETNVVLVGTIHHQDRYRRDPSDLYGADVYIESPDLPDGLLPLLRNAGLSVRDADASGPVSSMSPPEPRMEPEPELDLGTSSASLDWTAPSPSPVSLQPAKALRPADAPKPAEAEDPERTAERERAQRLSRIAVSEMVLYQPEKFDQATRNGTLERTLDLEIQEARALLRQRIGEEVRAETDFIIDELNRVAQERGGQA